MRSALLTLVAATTLSGCFSSQQEETTLTFSRLQQLAQTAPVANKVPYEASYHGLTLSDPYHWLKDQGYPKVDDEPVLDYLKQENAYYQSFLSPNEKLVNTLFEEFKGRVDETETSVPWQSNGYEYRWEYKEGADYKTWLRKKIGSDEEEVFLDESALAKDHKYFVLGDYAISPDNNLMAYSFDTSGDERYSAQVVNLQTGQLLDDVLTDVRGSLEFDANGQSLVYAQLEQDKWRANAIKVHTLGESQAQDKTLITEDDDSFFLGFGLTSSKKFLILASSQREISEIRVLPTADLFAEPKIMVERGQKFSASVDHANGHFYILANDKHNNSRLAEVADSNPEYANWKTRIAGSDDVYLRNMKTFSQHIVIKERVKGIDNIRIVPFAGDEHRVSFPESVYTANIGYNPEFNQSYIRLNYESMITPDTVFDYQVSDKALDSRKVKQIPSGYDKSQYETKRLMAPARDGVLVPVSIVYKKGYKQDASQPLSLYGYGAYGSGLSPTFSTLRLSLLDRGFAFAIAHVRGGDEMGYDWYLDGKLDSRTNTFNDFVDVAEYLVKEKYVAAGNISISGRSAGGELMGAAVIQKPDLWRSVILGVPFVDVLNTILDDTLPLTPPEWVEWGNPITSKHYYELIQSYSPYDNIEKRDYPPMMVTGGLNDPRVTYWEPAKWTAKMREFKTDNNLLVMRINMGAGHFANSGRFGRLKDYAEEYAFQLLAHGIDK